MDCIGDGCNECYELQILFLLGRGLVLWMGEGIHHGEETIGRYEE